MAIGNMLMSAGYIMNTLVVITMIVQIIANWKIFAKAGEASWKALVPIYNGYISFKIAGITNVFWVNLSSAFLSNYMTNSIMLSMQIPSASVWVLYGLCQLVVLITGIIFNYRLAKSFGKGIGFAAGLFLLTPIFALILAYGNARYRQKQ